MAAAHNPDMFRLAVDIGGTFTDIVLVGVDGTYWTKKVPSTPEDYAEGIMEGLGQLMHERELAGRSVQEIVHGTTIAINAILENKGAKTALITTKGFRDVLELRRLRVPNLYTLLEPPSPIVERRLRLEVDERIGAGGEVVRPLDEATVMPAMDRIRNDGVEAVAVCLLHSFSYPAHERRVGELLHQYLPDTYTSLSVDVLSEIREYERTSTTVINAYLGPIVRTYVESLVSKLKNSGIPAPLRIMQSNGGVMSAQRAVETPVQIVESGPAAGVVAAHESGKRVGLNNLISFDMGGTTAKASMIENGHRSWTTEHEIGAGISLSSRLVKGGGHPVKVPVIDLAEVGAGGGSVLWIDRGGALKVGPWSAGAVPGPICYGFGGEEPTITDANLVLGYVNPRILAGGAVTLRPKLASAALKEKVADLLGMDMLEAAYGVYTVANTTMNRAIRAVSTYRGRDPRDFSMMAFGGSGPMHAAEMARSLGISQVVVPPAPGLFSAVGLLEAQPEQHFVQTFFSPAAEVDLGEFNLAYQKMEGRGLETLTREGYAVSDFRWQRSADLRYVGQAYELTVDAPSRSLSREDLAALVEGFHQEHERTYGHMATDEPVEVVNLRTTARADASQTRPVSPSLRGVKVEVSRRDAYFGPQWGLLATPILGRSQLTETAQSGPLIVEEYDATTVVPPGCAARLDQWQNLVIEVG